MPRKTKPLKAGFQAEASTAARFRAYARRAEADALPNLARHWRSLARAKDELAIRQLEALARVKGGAEDLQDAISDERSEIESFYPRALEEMGDGFRDLFESILQDQRQHLAWMEALQGALDAASGDVEAPPDEAP